MSDCSCIYMGDYDGPEFCSELYPTAAKEHECGECGKTIEVGEKYEKTTGCWEGTFNTHKTCLDCVSMRDSFFCDGWCYTRIWEFLSDHIMEVQGQVSSECLVPLTPRAREKVCELIEEQWRELEENGGR